MSLELTILGASSAIPLSNRFPTSQFLTIANRHFLIDCGEGTQVRLRENGIGFGRINHILISHLHGDHFFGLTPLLSTLHLLDRHKEIHIYAPKGLKEVVQQQIKIQGSWLKYPLIFHELNMNEKDLVFEDEKVEVFSFPLDHSIACCGFLFREKEKERHFKKEILKKYSIPKTEIKQIKKGADWIDENGHCIPNEEMTTSADKSMCYAYCTDTRALSNLNTYFSDPDILYHESTFTEQHKKRAQQTGHSTAKEAAEIAHKVGAKQLIIGHFSIRYNDLTAFLEEAQSIFPNTHLAREGKTYVQKSAESELESHLSF